MADDDLATEGAVNAGPEADERPAGPALDKRALLKRIVTTTGVPVSQARKILDATLTEIAAAIDAGSSVSLPPFGKLRPVRKADQGGTAIHTMRLRRTPPLARIKASAEGVKATAEGDVTAAAGEAAVKPGAKARARVKTGAAARRTSAGAGARPARSSAASRKAAPATGEADEA